MNKKEFYNEYKKMYEYKYGDVENDNMFYSFIYEIEDINKPNIVDIIHDKIYINISILKDILIDEVLNEINNIYKIKFKYEDISNTLDKSINNIIKSLKLDNYNLNVKNNTNIITSNIKEELKPVIYDVLATNTTLDDYNLLPVSKAILNNKGYDTHYIFKNTDLFLITLKKACYNKKYIIDDILNNFNLSDEYIKSKQYRLKWYQEKAKNKLKLTKDVIVNDPNGSIIILNKKKNNFYIGLTTDVYLKNNEIIEPKIALIMDLNNNIYTIDEFNKIVGEDKQIVFDSIEDLIIYIGKNISTLNDNKDICIYNIKDSLKKSLVNAGLYTFSFSVSYLILKLITDNPKIGVIAGINIGFFLGREITDHIIGKKFIIPNLINYIKYNNTIKNETKIATELDKLRIDSTIISDYINKLLNEDKISLENLKNLKNYINNDLIYGILNKEDTSIFDNNKKLVLE